MCCGSAARRRFGAADHALAQVRPRQFFFTGGGVVRLTAKPRYLLLHHRGKEKSNTVTALISGQLYHPDISDFMPPRINFNSEMKKKNILIREEVFEFIP